MAQESGDIAFGAQVLADMSQQARMLGYPREALQLAIVGRHDLAKAYSPAPAARLLALEAQAHAALGDSNAAVLAVIESERAAEAAKFARRSISAAASQDRVPCVARSQARLARAALIRRDLDTALHAAHQAVELSATAQSSRCIATIRDLQSRISPYRTLADARDFNDRAHELLTQASLD